MFLLATLCYAACLVLMRRALASAPEAYEDEFGFHLES
jgi:hypothetical protein